MERLTERLPNLEGELDEIAFKNPKDPEGLYNLRDIVNSSGDELVYEIATRLAHYEDLAEQGRLVELPCTENAVLVRRGRKYNADHWNHILTAFRDDPEASNDKDLALFSVSEAEAALEKGAQHETT